MTYEHDYIDINGICYKMTDRMRQIFDTKDRADEALTDAVVALCWVSSSHLPHCTETDRSYIDMLAKAVDAYKSAQDEDFDSWVDSQVGNPDFFTPEVDE